MPRLLGIATGLSVYGNQVRIGKEQDKWYLSRGRKIVPERQEPATDYTYLNNTSVEETKMKCPKIFGVHDHDTNFTSVCIIYDRCHKINSSNKNLVHRCLACAFTGLHIGYQCDKYKSVPSNLSGTSTSVWLLINTVPSFHISS
jgi:hypothetical protein